MRIKINDVVCHPFMPTQLTILYIMSQNASEFPECITLQLSILPNLSQEFSVLGLKVALFHQEKHFLNLLRTC